MRSGPYLGSFSHWLKYPVAIVVGDVHGVLVGAGVALSPELAAFACLGAHPYMALACVEVGVVAEDAHVVVVLVAVCWWLVVVSADAVSGVGYRWVYHT